MAEMAKTYGIWGDMRKKFMEEYRPGDLGVLIGGGKVDEYFTNFNEIYQEKADEQLPQILVRLGVTEALKAQDPMEWIGRYNQAKEELKELLQAEIEEADEEDNEPELLPYSKDRFLPKD